jgi:hypothetical protein
MSRVTALVDQLLAGTSEEAGVELGLWLQAASASTWRSSNARADLSRMFDEVYEELSKDERAEVTARLCQAAENGQATATILWALAKTRDRKASAAIAKVLRSELETGRTESDLAYQAVASIAEFADKRSVKALADAQQRGSGEVADLAGRFLDALDDEAVPVSDLLQAGELYARADLERVLGVEDRTLYTGVFKPPRTTSILLFVTEKKSKDRIQYVDHFEGDVLVWHGQRHGRSDALIREHESAGLEVLVFYRKSVREFPRAAFRYMGAYRYVSDTGDASTVGGRVFRLTPSSASR